MKNRNWILILLIILCVVCFVGYRVVDRTSTDTVPPVITSDGSVPQVSVNDPKTVLTQGLTALDDRNGDVTASLVVESVELLDADGTIRVKCAAFDRSGNVAKITREAKYVDYESPRFVLKAPLLYKSGITFDVLSNVGAVDPLDGDIQHRVRATALGNDSISNLGSHQVCFQVTNTLGETVSLTLPVEVYSGEQYSATLTLTDYLIYVPVGTVFDARDYLGEFSLRGERTRLTGGLPEGFTMLLTGSVNTQEPGVYALDYRVTRHEGSGVYGQSYAGYSRLIVVVEG